MEDTACLRLSVNFTEKLTGSRPKLRTQIQRPARAEMRMADEIDRGQAEGAVAGQGGDRSKVQTSDLATCDDLGISKQRVSEWRDVRDAGEQIISSSAMVQALRV